MNVLVVLVFLFSSSKLLKIQLSWNMDASVFTERKISFKCQSSSIK